MYRVNPQYIYIYIYIYIYSAPFPFLVWDMVAQGAAIITAGAGYSRSRQLSRRWLLTPPLPRLC